MQLTPIVGAASAEKASRSLLSKALMQPVH